MTKEFCENITVYHADTDAYGVVWHGACVKWFEKGRIEFAKLCGLDTFKLEEEGIVLPVVNLEVRYKSSAFLGEELKICTKLHEIKRASITFEHIVSEATTNKIHIIAKTTVVAVDKSGKLCRNLPPCFTNLQ